MIKQQSFKNEEATLFVVATPIGNLQEMTPRAIDILKNVAVIAAEDTRNARKICAHFQITTPIISYHQHNEQASSAVIVQRLSQGDDVALISDAGYPLISDPGSILVNAVIAAGCNVVPISGSCAFINALVVSGIPPQPFAFMGFMEAKDAAIRKQLQSIKALPMTAVFYLSVHKMEKTLKLVHEELGNRSICLAREITKLHEEFIRGTVLEVIANIEVVKGEYVLIIEAVQETTETDWDELADKINDAIAKGMSPSRAIALVAKNELVSKNELYAYYIGQSQK